MIRSKMRLPMAVISPVKADIDTYFTFSIDKNNRLIMGLGDVLNL